MERRRLFRAADRPGRPTARDPHGAWLNRVHSYEVGDGAASRTVHFPRSCLHCEKPACVTVCPTGASYKRAEDGIVLVDPDTCIGCKLCSWACPYGAREYDYDDGVMKKCTLCVDRIYNETSAPEDRIPACVRACPTGARHFGDLGDPDSAVSQLVAERGGFDLLPEIGYKPVNKYLPPRPRRDRAPRRRRRLRAARRAASGSLADRVLRLGRQDAVALNSHDASRLFGHLLHHGLRRRLRPADLARALASRSASCRDDPVFGSVGLGLALALITAGCCLDAASRPAGARLARLLAMAHVLAVARGRRGARHLCSGRRARRSAGCSARSRAGQIAVRRVACGAVRAGHALVHRNDLRLAADHPRLAPAAGRAGLHRAGAGDRRRAARAAARALRPRRPLAAVG